MMTITRLRISFMSLLVAGLLLVPGLAGAQTSDPGPGTPPEFSDELISCLKTALGSTYQSVVSPNHETTDEEIEKGEPCFEQYGPKIDPSNQPKPENLTFAPGTEKCLAEKLGAGFRSEFVGQKTKEQAKAFRAKTKDCFGRNVPGNGPGELPTEVRSCIVGTVGQAEADKMLKGNPPAPGSDLFKKIEGAKCFKNFGPPPGHDRPNISPEAQACVEKITGSSFDQLQAEPTEEQKQQIGKCFGGGPGGPGGPQMPKEVQSCLSSAFGDSLEDLKKGPEFLTEAQWQLADACFRQNNFNPGGQGGPGGPGGPAPDPKTEECIKKIAGSSRPENLSEDLKRKIGDQCFKGSGPSGQGGGPRLDPAKEACVTRVAGGKNPQSLTEEDRQKIGKECFGGGGPGGPGGPQGQDPAKEECIKRVTGGKSFNQQTDDERRRIGQECFGGGGPGGPGPGNAQGQPPQGEYRGDNRGPEGQQNYQPPARPEGSNGSYTPPSSGTSESSGTYPPPSGSSGTYTPPTDSSGSSGDSGSSGTYTPPASGSSGSSGTTTPPSSGSSGTTTPPTDSGSSGSSGSSGTTTPPSSGSSGSGSTGGTTPPATP